MGKITMSWNDRFAMIDHYNPTDEQIVATFGLTFDELSTARSLRAAGTFAVNKSMDVAKYGNVFTGEGAIVNQGVPANLSLTPGAFTRGTATTHSRPETAAKKLKSTTPKKRGRKGDKIATALQAVPLIKVPVDQFIAQYGISLAVLRQSKRFILSLAPEVAATIGKINVKQDKATKALVIWREPAD